MRQLLYQVCYTRYQVSFYLWWIGYVLKYCKVPKYYDQDCRLNRFFCPLLYNSFLFLFLFFIALVKNMNRWTERFAHTYVLYELSMEKFKNSLHNYLLTFKHIAFSKNKNTIHISFWFQNETLETILPFRLFPMYFVAIRIYIWRTFTQYWFL